MWPRTRPRMRSQVGRSRAAETEAQAPCLGRPRYALNIPGCTDRERVSLEICTQASSLVFRCPLESECGPCSCQMGVR